MAKLEKEIKILDVESMRKKLEKTGAENKGQIKKYMYMTYLHYIIDI